MTSVTARLFVGVCSALALTHAAAAGFPEKPIRIVTPFSAGSVTDLAGRIDLVIGAAGPVLPHVKSGRLRALGVSAATRDPAMPEVPTIIEQGVPGFEVIGWYGLLAPAGTPAPVIRKLFTEIVRILALPDVKALYANAGLEVAVSASPAEFAALIRSERDKWAKVIKAANIRIE